MKHLDYIYEYSKDNPKSSGALPERYMVSIICPAYNEEAIIEENINTIRQYMDERISDEYDC
ncbi:MAG: hypothetical protein ACOC3T_04430 [Bacteroidota bacterium]